MPPHGPDAVPSDRPSGGPVFSIEGFPLGPFETNCYLVYAPAPSSECWIVDAGFEPGELIERVRDLKLEPSMLLLTHAHGDHIAGVREVLAAFPRAALAVHPAERDWLDDPAKNLSLMLGLPVTTPAPARLLGHGDSLVLAGTAWTVLHTPGHSPGGITLHNASKGVALVGDTLFAGSVGRTDFPGSDPALLARSIRERLYTLPPETMIYSGHGPASTIAREMRSNPFVRA